MGLVTGATIMLLQPSCFWFYPISTASLTPTCHLFERRVALICCCTFVCQFSCLLQVYIYNCGHYTSCKSSFMGPLELQRPIQARFFTFGKGQALNTLPRHHVVIECSPSLIYNRLLHYQTSGFENHGRLYYGYHVPHKLKFNVQTDIKVFMSSKPLPH